MSLHLFWERIKAAFSRSWGETGSFWIQESAGPFLVFWNSSEVQLMALTSYCLKYQRNLWAELCWCLCFQQLLLRARVCSQSFSLNCQCSSRVNCSSRDGMLIAGDLGSLFSCPPCGDGLRKTEALWHSWNKEVEKRSGCEGYWSNGSDWGGGKMKIRIKSSWKNTWIKVSLQGWQDRWGYKEVIDGCKSFGCSSVGVDGVRKEQRKTKSSHGNREKVPDFLVQKGATTAGGRMWNICVSCSRFLDQTWLDLAINCQLLLGGDVSAQEGDRSK